MGSMIEMPTRSAAPSAHARQVRSWSALLSIELPDGIVRHPRLVDQVEDEVGRACGVHLDFEGIRVGFGLDGRSRDEAIEDCEQVTERVLGRIGLGTDARVEVDVYDRDVDLGALGDLHSITENR
ncbi:MAG: hypothetical protein ACK5O2_12145 [Microthrixaceae bacterium]